MPPASDTQRRDWFLSGARVALGPDEAPRLDVHIRQGRIAELAAPGAGSPSDPAGVLRLDGCLLLPGLINAHDHLEFSLFPRLGQGPYRNARDWALAVYQPSQPPVREQLQVQKPIRMILGGLRNLVSGVSTVCHHNPYEPEVFGPSFPVRVVERFGWAHSLDFSGDIAARFAATPPGWPFIIHLGEGTDESARRQVFDLDQMGALDGRTAGVHGVGLDAAGWDLLEKRGSALIWCPTSNLFTLGATLDAAVFERKIPIALGTDSPLTACGDLLDELRAAGQLARTSRRRLYEMVTTEAAAVLRLDQGEGRLTAGGVADVIAVPDCGSTPWEALSDGDPCGPSLVIVGGKIKLVAESLAGRVAPEVILAMSRLQVAGRPACRVDADVPGILAAARNSLPSGEPLRLGGKAIEI